MTLFPHALPGLLEVGHSGTALVQPRFTEREIKTQSPSGLPEGVNESLASRRAQRGVPDFQPLL